MAYAGFLPTSPDSPLRAPAEARRLGNGWWTRTDDPIGNFAWTDQRRALWLHGRPRIDGVVATPERLAALAARLARDGAAALGGVHGGFAIAWVDTDARHALLAIDGLGIGDLYIAPSAEGLAFATSIGGVLGLPGVEAVVSPQAVFEYLYFHMIPSPGTIYGGVVRLQPGECLRWTAGRIEQGFHWRPQFDEDAHAPLPDLKRAFIDALEASVRDAMEGVRVGAFLSGGTDSSTIAGLATRILGTSIDTYSIGFDAAGYDEMEYARIAARHFGTRHHEYYVTPQDVIDAVPKVAAAHDQPFGNASAVPAYCCARLARSDGVERMLAGDGGDELFGGNARYAKQYLFSLYERVPRWLRDGVIEPASHMLSKGPRLPFIGKVGSYVEQASLPMPSRLESYNGLMRLGLENVLSERVLASIDRAAPMRAMSIWYFNPTARSLINRMLAVDFKITLADSDLPKVTRSCALAGLPVAYPMLDERVVGVSLKLAPDLKLRGTALRWFFKEALRGFLPDAIIRKPKHGFGLPFGEWVLAHPSLRDLAFDNLDALKHRDLVRPEFIDRLRSTLMREHPGYYGPLVWVLMMLEQWHSVHV